MTGGALKWQGEHPKHVFPRLKFAPLNRESRGILHSKQVFFSPTLNK